jgi:uncharacterized membrane-anchored protein YhcB (DUF1043 family)
VDLTPKLRAVEAAQRNVAKTARDVTDAQKALKAAQLDVAKAFATARERLQDLDREYRQSKLDQAEQAQNLLQAEEELRLAQARGNPDEIAKARLAVDKQRLAVEEATDKTEDLGKENTEAAKKGVAGSDEVVAARAREAAAQRQVQDAVEAHKLAIQSLGDAQKSLAEKTAGAAAAGAGLGVVLPRIAQSAQQFLDKLKQLKPAFDNLRLEVQQRLFAGLADKLQTLADRWFPALQIHLGTMADTINGVVKTAFDSLSQTTFVQNIMTAIDATSSALGKVGNAIAGPFVDAFGRLARASAPFLDMLGTKVADLITNFSTWIAKLDDSGELDAFMAKASHIFGGLFDIFTDLARIAGDVINILFGTNVGSTDAWDNLATAVHKVADFMGDPAVQAKISTFLNFFGSAVFWIGDFITAMDDIATGVQNALAWIKAFPQNAGAYLSQLPGIMAHWASEAVGKLGYWIGYGIGWVLKQFWDLPRNIDRLLSGLGGVLWNAGVAAWNAFQSINWSDLGRNVVIGLWNGIAALGGWLWNQAVAFASSIWQGMAHALHISSPSRVMADKVGQWIPKGIAAGMDAHRGTVMDAAQRIADDLAGTQLAMPGPDLLSGAMAAAQGTLTLAAAKPKQVTVVLDVRGQEGPLKTLVRGMARTGNLYQNKG